MTLPGEANSKGSESMNSTKTMASVGAMAVALGVGLTATSAPAMTAPTASGARLSIYTDPATPKSSRVTIDGLFPMSEAGPWSSPVTG
jgi:hypothetical protein